MSFASINYFFLKNNKKVWLGKNWAFGGRESAFLGEMIYSSEGLTVGVLPMSWGPGPGHGHQLAASAQGDQGQSVHPRSKCLDSRPHPLGLCWGTGGQMEKYLPVERKAQANTRTLVVFKDTSCSLLKSHGPLSMDKRFLGGLQMFALVGLCYKWTWFCLVG